MLIKRVKRAKFLSILPLVNGMYQCINLVTNDKYTLTKKEHFLVDFLSTPKTLKQIEIKFKNIFSKSTLKKTINNLLEKNILISQKNSFADSFKENLIIVGFGDYSLFKVIFIHSDYLSEIS